MIQSRAMLVNLVIRQWSARKLDRSASAEIDKTHGASDAGRYNKLIIDKSALEPITKIASAMRDRHYHFTMPWGDNGDRLLPSSLYFEYIKEMRDFIQQFNARSTGFISAYPALVQAARVRLGTLYDPNDYPAASTLYAKFDAGVSFSSVPFVDDFRVDLDKDQVEQIKANMSETIVARQNDAVRSCYVRAAEIVSRIRERLSVKDGVFRDSLIENARALVDLLPSLNITGDADLENLRLEISESLLIEPSVLRNHPDVRQKTADAADSILSRLKGVYG